MTPTNGGLAPEAGGTAGSGRFGRLSALVGPGDPATAPADGARRADGPDRSPDFLGAPATRGRGVRRLNRVPLLVALGVLTMVFGALMYTVYQRAATRRQRAAQDAPAEQPLPASPPMFADAPAAGVIPPTGATGAPEPPAGLPFDPNYGVAGATPGVGVPGSGDGGGEFGGYGPAGGANAAELDAARLQAWQMYRQEVATLRQQRFQHAVEAQDAASRVEVRGGMGGAAGAMEGDPAADASVQALMALAQQATASGDPAAAGSAGAPVSGTGAPGTNALARAAAGGGASAWGGAGGAGRAAPRNDPDSPYALTQGMVIPAMLLAGVNSDLPGQVLAQVSEPVYDGATGEQVLIPQGAKLVGTYATAQAMGQQRVLVAWRRVIYPDGSALDLAGPGGPGAMPGGGMPGADQAGAAGFRDRVDNHYRQTFGHALLLSLFSAGVQLSQPQRGGGVFAAPTPGEIAAGALGQQLGQLGMETARRGLNVAPRLEIRPGYRFNVMVTQDVPVRAWTGVGGAVRAGGQP